MNSYISSGAVLSTTDISVDTSKAIQAREAIAFCDHWKATTGHDLATLVMNQKVTTQDVLGELDACGVEFLALRMRSPALTRHISGLQPVGFKTVALDRGPAQPAPPPPGPRGPARH